MKMKITVKDLVTILDLLDLQEEKEEVIRIYSEAMDAISEEYLEEHA